MIRGFIFDYGGTLDTGGCHWGLVFWHTYQRLAIPISEPQFRQAYVHTERKLGHGGIIMPDYTFRQTLDIKVALQLQNLGIDNKFAAPIVDDVYAQTLHHTARSRSVLRRLSSQYPLALVSNFYGNLRTVLHEFDFDGLFCHVIESASVGIRKPDERIFLLGLQALQFPPEQVVVVGDSLKNDIMPAQRLGCQTIWYRGEQWEEEK